MRLIKGLLVFIKDCWRLFVWTINRPLAVVLFVALFFGAFAAFGVYPSDVPNWFSKTLKPAVSQRINDLKRNAAAMSKAVEKKAPLKGKRTPSKTQIIPQNAEEEMILRDLGIPVHKTEPVSNPVPVEPKAQLPEIQEKIWKEVIERQQPDPFEFVNPNDIVEGQILVISADTIKIDKTIIKLNIKLRGGKAGQAFIVLKRNYEGRMAKCILSAQECFVGYNNVAQTLLDQGLAD